MACAPIVRHLALSFVATALAIAGSGCGGGGGGGGTTVILAPITDLTVVSDGSAPVGSGLLIGDTVGNLSTRAGLRFGTFMFVPPDAIITSATLRLRQNGVAGNPYTLLGTIVVDRVSFGALLNAADYGAAVLEPNVGTVSLTAALETKDVDVTAAVAADVAGPFLVSDFLVRFTAAVAADGAADFAQFEDAANSLLSGFTPTLIITFE
jgi:hypothetical protein